MLELRLNHLSKHYSNKIAVNQVDYAFTRGVYGLLGANGAGKTTMMRMICNILKPTSGEVLCNDSPIDKLGGDYRRLLGYLPQEFGYYPDFTAHRYLMYLASLKALPREVAADKVEELLELVELSQVKKHRLKTFSGGMLRRLGIAQAMLNDPRILILDEPTSGLDPKERIRFRNIISSLGSGRIVILSTHIVSDVEFIADQILLMKNGSLIKSGDISEILAPVAGKVWECEVDAREANDYSSRYAVSNLKHGEKGVRLRIVSEDKPAANAVSAEPNLEDGYLHYFEEYQEESRE